MLSTRTGKFTFIGNICRTGDRRESPYFITFRLGDSLPLENSGRGARSGKFGCGCMDEGAK